MGARAPRTPRGIAIATTMPFLPSGRDAIVGAIHGPRQLVVGALGVALRVIRNDVVGVIDHVVDLEKGENPRLRRRRLGKSHVDRPYGQCGEGRGLVQHPDFVILNIRVMRVIVCTLFASAGAVGQTT